MFQKDGNGSEIMKLDEAGRQQNFLSRDLLLNSCKWYLRDFFLSLSSKFVFLHNFPVLTAAAVLSPGLVSLHDFFWIALGEPLELELQFVRSVVGSLFR